MIADLTRKTPVIVQGAGGRAALRHIDQMLEFGTNVVAGVSSRAGHMRGSIPLFETCREAVDATGSIVSLVMSPADRVLQATEEALDAGIRLIVTIAEGVPVQDALRIGAMIKTKGAQWIGASTPGLVIPGEIKIGFLPDVSIRPGTLGLMAKSGTLAYEVGYRLVGAGLGQSLWVGVGGDPVKGTRFADLLQTYQRHGPTKAIVLIGEVGGNEEEEFAAALEKSSSHKQVYALIAGANAKEGVSMGHAGALVFGKVGSFQSKKQALERAGARVFSTVEELVTACRASQ